MDTYLLTIWPQHAIVCCLKTDDLELSVLRSFEVKSEDRFELAAYGFLFAPHTIAAPISDCLATTRHLLPFAMSENG